ncbi:MAG: hypothetical protein ACKO37_04530 [Vampirovibrionales bacterium]
MIHLFSHFGAMSHLKQMRLGAFVLCLSQIVSPFLWVSLGSQSEVCYGEPSSFQGKVVTQGNTPQVSTGPLEVQSGTVLDISISTTAETSLSQVGEDFYGKISKDYYIGSQLAIPAGTVLHGTISQVVAPKRAGRDGYASVKFDQMIFPDGREISMSGEASSQASQGKRILNATARVAGHTLGGALIGTLMMARSGGIVLTGASSGYNFIGAAAVGAGAGLGVALARKGEHKSLDPGAGLQIRLETPLHLTPSSLDHTHLHIREQKQMVDGLKVTILETQALKDMFGEPTLLQVTLDIENRTASGFTLFDIALVDSYETAHFLSPFGSEDTLGFSQKISPQSRLKGTLTFQVDNPQLTHRLVLYKQYTREPLASIPLSFNIPKVTLSKKSPRTP